MRLLAAALLLLLLAIPAAQPPPLTAEAAVSPDRVYASAQATYTLRVQADHQATATARIEVPDWLIIARIEAPQPCAIIAPQFAAGPVVCKLSLQASEAQTITLTLTIPRPITPETVIIPAAVTDAEGNATSAAAVLAIWSRQFLALIGG